MLVLIAIVVSIPIILTLLLSNKRVQNYVVDYATEIVSEALDADVKIKTIEYRMPASVKINGIYVGDQRNDTLAYIGSLTARLGMRAAIFNKQIAIKDVAIDGLHFHLKSDSTGVTNLQFIIDALTDTTSVQEPLDLVFAAPDVELTNSCFKFDNISVPQKNDGTFDEAHVELGSIDLKATLDYATTDSVLAHLDHLSCKERSGLTINKLKCSYRLGKEGMSVDDFSLSMPNSVVSMPVAEIRYDSIQQLSNPQQLLDRSYISVNVSPSYLSGKDFNGFTPLLVNLRNDLNIRTSIEYKDGILHLHQLNATYGNSTSANLKAMVSGVPEAIKDSTFDIGKISLYAEVYNVATDRADIENTISDLTKRPFLLPKEISGLKRIQYRGTIAGSVSNAKYVGRLTTNAGIIQTDANGGFNNKSGLALINGSIKLSDFNLAEILDKEMKMGKVSLDITASGSYYANQKRLAASVSGNLKSLEYNGYTFENIDISALYNPEKAAADISFVDKNGNGSVFFDALYDNSQEEKTLTVNLDVNNLKLGNMNLTPDLPTLAVSVQMNEDSRYTSIDAVEGTVRIDSLIIYNEGEQFILDSINIDAIKESEENRKITLRSPILTANVNGKYTPSTVFNNITYLISRELTNIKPLNTEKMPSSNNFTFDATLMPLNEISRLFKSDKTIADTTFIKGSFNDFIDDIELKLFTNDIKLGNITYDSVRVTAANYGENTMNVNLDAIYETFLDTTYWKASVDLLNNNVDIDYTFWNTMESDYSGELKLSTEFFKPHYPDATIEALCTIHDSELTLNDSIWNIKKGTIFYDEHNLIVKDFAFEGADQHLRIEGESSKDDAATRIEVDLKGVDLYYISNVVYMPDIKLLGIASGKVIVANALNKDPELDADVEVKGFGLNGFKVANARGKAKFNHDNKRIELFAEVLNEKGDSSFLNGYVAPVEKEMLLDIQFKELSLKFIEPYLVSFSHEMDGIASGRLFVGGPLDKIELWGDAYVHDGKLGIDYLQSTFHFADSVHIKKDRFIFKDIHLTDDYGNTGIVDGLVTHKYFQNFKYKIGFSIDKFRVLNTTAEEFPDFYGTVFASGKAMIEGDESKVDINVTAKPEAGSYFAVPLDSYRSATDKQFITFVKKDTLKHESFERGRKRFLETAPTTKLNVNLDIEATPDVEARIIMDSHSGDVIRGRGNGNIKVSIDQNVNVKLYGKYAITEGDYNFSLQGAIRKKFDVGENSSITFDGDPMNGIMDIKAKYQTTASLTDLLEEGMLADINNTNVKVNCMANITGKLLEPKIKFDVELPNADDEIVRRVKATINTDDMMIQQMVFLLVFGKFYNPQLATQTAATSYASSFVTSSISSQLNYWMSQISNNVNLGFNYNDSQKDSYNNYSVAVNVSTNLFNNRLILNGNIGYQRQKNGQENFIGDFDVEYKLTKSGRFRLKAYNKTNDVTYSTSLYTQGLGVMYKETFDTWKNLGETYKELTRKKTPEEKAEIAKQKEKEKAEKAKRKAAKKALKEDRKRRHKEYVAQQKALKAAAKAEKEMRNEK